MLLFLESSFFQWWQKHQTWVPFFAFFVTNGIVGIEYDMQRNWHDPRMAWWRRQQSGSPLLLTVAIKALLDFFVFSGTTFMHDPSRIIDRKSWKSSEKDFFYIKLAAISKATSQHHHIIISSLHLQRLYLHIEASLHSPFYTSSIALVSLYYPLYTKSLCIHHNLPQNVSKGQALVCLLRSLLCLSWWSC